MTADGRRVMGGGRVIGDRGDRVMGCMHEKWWGKMIESVIDSIQNGHRGKMSYCTMLQMHLVPVLEFLDEWGYYLISFESQF